MQISTIIKIFIPFFVLFIVSCVSDHFSVKERKEQFKTEILRELKKPNDIILPIENNYYKIPCFLYKKIDTKEVIDIYPPNIINVNNK